MINRNELKNMEKNLTRGLLDIIVLNLLRYQSMHGYKIINNVQKNFGIHFGPSTIYPFLKELENKKCIESNWEIEHEQPRKVYNITKEGNHVLTSCEYTFNQICSKLNAMGLDHQ